MATYSSDVILKNSNISTHGESKVRQGQYVVAALTTPLVANDVINLCYLPPYARVVGAVFSADQLDTNGTATLALEAGDGGFTGVPALANRYFTTTTIGRVAAPAAANTNQVMNPLGQNFYNNQNVPLLITATCLTAAATWQAGNIYFRIDYYASEPASALNQ